jgi:hypothetical protein
MGQIANHDQTAWRNNLNRVNGFSHHPTLQHLAHHFKFRKLRHEDIILKGLWASFATSCPLLVRK